jgi:two-component system copper resistance phosphate regulon response regulator CusR
MRVLVIEGETKTAAYVRKGLAESGFRVHVARTGVDGLHLALTNDYDAIILALTLPGLDRWSVLRTIRQAKGTPVLCLTARDRVEDRVRGFELGADDYLVKPFAFSEFVARLRAIMRRGHAPEPGLLRVADLEIDAARRKVRRAGTRLELTPQEFSLLYVLASHAGQVLSRTRLAEQVWDTNFDGDSNVVDVAVRRLRAKVDDPFAVRLIHTVRGVGYVLEEGR